MCQLERQTIPTPQIRILHQNVGGIRLEGNRGGGAKLGVVKSMTTPSTDFVFLSETKCAKQNICKLKLKFGLKLSLTSDNRAAAAAGIAIFSKPEHKLLEGSERHSTPQGHTVTGVYSVQGTNVIVTGVYGVSVNNDRLSSLVFENLIEQISELKLLFNTTYIIIAGDFNCGLADNDFSTRNMRPRTTGTILRLMEDNDLYDLGTATGQLGHTYFRRGNTKISSRIDLVLSNIRSPQTHFFRQPTIFDHLSTYAIFGENNNRTTITMKDFILSSGDFIEMSGHILVDLCAQYRVPENCLKFHPPDPPENEDLDSNDFLEFPPPPPG
jgi:exonuclease III